MAVAVGDGSNLVLSTARSALDRMKETPGFKYCHSSSMHYRWIQKSDPAMFAEVQQRVREGRWEVVGGWPVEPDCNIPASESFVRHGLYGKRYCQKNLGVDVKIGLNPDSFGHAAGLPTILKQTGYNYYVFMRPAQGEDHTTAPLPLLFWWEGPDGSRVLALRIPHSYDNPASRIPDAAKDSFAPGFSHAAFFMGVGDHGGAVTKEQIQQVLQLRKDPSLPELRWSTVREFFQAVETSPAMANLPVVRGGIQHSARGCYSANGEEKFLNRRAERGMVEAESLAWLAGSTLNRTYPKPEFENAWWNILFNQFHDLMAGSALYSDYMDARDGLGTASQTATASKVESLESIAKQVDTSKADGGLVFVFNPLPWRRKTLLQYIPGGEHVPGTPHQRVAVTYLQAQDGTKIPAQVRPSESMTTFYTRLAAWIDLPPFGYQVFSAQIDAAVPPAPTYGTSITVAENGFGITSLKAADGAELLASQIGLVNQRHQRYLVAWHRQLPGGDRAAHVFRSKVMEDGPVMRVTRQWLRWQESDIAVDVTTYPHLDIVRLHFVSIGSSTSRFSNWKFPLRSPTRKCSPWFPGRLRNSATMEMNNLITTGWP